MSESAPRKSPAELVELHLDRELALQRRLIAVAEAKRDALVANDNDALTAQVERERAAATDLAALRPVRERLVRGLAQHLGAATPTMSAVIAKLGDRAEPLETRRRELAELATRAQSLATTNQELVRTGLRLLDGLLDLLVGAGASAGGYDRRGAVARPGGGGLVDVSG